MLLADNPTNNADAGDPDECCEPPPILRPSVLDIVVHQTSDDLLHVLWRRVIDYFDRYFRRHRYSLSFRASSPGGLAPGLCNIASRPTSQRHIHAQWPLNVLSWDILFRKSGKMTKIAIS